MFQLRPPRRDRLRTWLDGQRSSDLTYAPLGVTRNPILHGFRVDHTRARLGEGEACFLAASRALRQWEQFNLGWLTIFPQNVPLATGQCVGVVAHSLGLWSANAARIVYVVDDAGPPVRFGFAYGTLVDHVARGEERFLVEWLREDDSVWFDILAVSRPRHLLAWLGYPWLRRMQRRFGRDAVAAMRRAVPRICPPSRRSARQDVPVTTMKRVASCAFQGL
ncbi:MAG: DUF1990 domain-containing protein [Planctomycetaceae bacterium]|nr:DUF1990 domain-containing protein [Planctomycetaceae bacterium]